MSRRWTRVVLLPAVALTAGGCLATRGDVERLELTVRALQDAARMQQATSDSLTRALVREAGDQLAQQFARQFAVVSDSVRQVSAGVQRLQGDVTLSMHDLRTQLATVQEGIGQAQRRIQDVRTSVEASATQPAPRPADPGAAAPQAGTSQAAPPAAVLWSMGQRALLNRATASARENFQTLINVYPTDERVPGALANIAAAFADEGNRPAADSVYALVVERYPASDRAANALYKRAGLALDIKDTARARSLLQQVIDKYPKSDERQIAEELLKSLKP